MLNNVSVGTNKSLWMKINSVGIGILNSRKMLSDSLQSVAQDLVVSSKGRPSLSSCYLGSESRLFILEKCNLKN